MVKKSRCDRASLTVLTADVGGYPATTASMPRTERVPVA